jgi:DNA-binding response OmpR family regulator
MRIVWLDDDFVIIEPVIEPLIEAGHEIARMRTIGEALEAIELLQTCDLIILDMILPIGDLQETFGVYSGVSLLQKLREEHEVASPVIVFSVVDPAKVKSHLEPLGVKMYVRKPALPSELKDAVDAVLRRKEPRASDLLTPEST